MTLGEISSQTRISERFLNAIENEAFGELPGTLFTRNFVRQYALALQLDPEPLLAQLPRVDVTQTAFPSAPASDRRTVWDPRWNSLFAGLAWLVLAVAAAAMAWVHFNRPATGHAEASAPIAKPVIAPVPQPAAAAAPADQHPVQVVLTAKEAAWVQVTADGKVAFTATLQPNESRSVSADEMVKVMTGNAGGVAITLNGKALKPLGPFGQVRAVTLTAAGPQFVRKTPPPPPDPL